MATSIVAQSKINMAKDKGEEIPLGWALDINGKPTTNALDACKGMILPMAGAKGYGLSMMIDLLAGLLSGASFLNQVGRFYNPQKKAMDVGQVFVAINPTVVYGNRFYQRIDEYINTLKSSEALNGEPITLPGEKKLSRYMDSMNNGIFLTEELLCSLAKANVLVSGGGNLKLDFSLRWAA